MGKEGWVNIFVKTKILYDITHPLQDILFCPHLNTSTTRDHRRKNNEPQQQTAQPQNKSRQVDKATGLDKPELQCCKTATLERGICVPWWSGDSPAAQRCFACVCLLD